MHFPIVIHKDADSDYGVSVPDLPGCFSAGATIEEAMQMAREAIELHLQGMIEDGEPIPPAGNLERHQANPDYVGSSWALVPVNLSDLGLRARRVQITIPERTLRAIDQHALARGATRSGFLTEAAIALIGNVQLPTSKKERPVGKVVSKKGRRPAPTVPRRGSKPAKRSSGR